ncbi:hypothetical protein MSAN_01097500 [Mycena sanguinolenta]|uniref:Uncharacterized protein n=1 Tax=Mycena sanguinolenta TaxID=230812 RepID=A0A8H6YV06_9AGAR|nr:hypothetical protein MSAN_01097500 [Mycena sanguinolenta]
MNAPGHGIHPPRILDASPSLTVPRLVVIAGAGEGCSVIGATRAGVRVCAAGGAASSISCWAEDIFEDGVAAQPCYRRVIDSALARYHFCSLPPPPPRLANYKRTEEERTIRESDTMPPTEYFLRLQRGIAGGFAPPTPSAVYTLTQSSAQPNTIAVTLAKREDGTPELSSALPKSLPAASSEALVEELHAILKTLPLEEPRGSEDIYGLDTSIAWGSEDLEWCNGGPEGCSGGKSMKQASAEEKEKFKRAVEIVQELADRAEKEG